jgi:hypothetical protein
MAGRNNSVGECVESPAAPKSSRARNDCMTIECPEARACRRRRNATGSPVVVLIPLWSCCNATRSCVSSWRRCLHSVLRQRAARALAQSTKNASATPSLVVGGEHRSTGNGTLPRTYLFLPYRLQYKDKSCLLLSNCHPLEMNYTTGGHRTGSDPTVLHRRWLQKMSVKVQVLNANLVPM